MTELPYEDSDPDNTDDAGAVGDTDNDDIDDEYGLQELQSSFAFLLGEMPSFRDAKCKNRGDAKIWEFAVPGERKMTARLRRYRATRICGECVHKIDCREWANDHGEVGVWGGEIFPPDDANFLKCNTCKRPMLKNKGRRKHMPRGHRLLSSETECVECAYERRQRDKRHERQLQRERRNSA